MSNIYLGLTTTWGSDWCAKVREINDLGIEELALFPTALEYQERQELFQLLDKSNLKRAPFVHLRTDMMRVEIDQFVNRFDSEIFNIHPSKEALQFLADNHDLAPKIYVENCLSMDYFEETLKLCAGICLDISHYEDFALIQHTPGQDRFIELLKDYKVGCTHMPAVRKEPYEAITHGETFKVYECHTMNEMSEMDYLKKHKECLGEFNAIELNNSFLEQLQVKKYLEKIFELE